MGNNPPLSLTTWLGKIRAAGRKLASLSLVRGLLRSIPGLPTAALAVLSSCSLPGPASAKPGGVTRRRPSR